MRRLPTSWRTFFLSATLLLLAACPHEAAPPNEILLGGASDEVLGAFRDAIAAGLVTTDDARAAHLTAPTEGATLARATPATFTWIRVTPGPRPRHGLKNGVFVWLHLAGPGLDPAVDVLAPTVDSSWTPPAADWATLGAASGTVTITITTGTFDDGILGTEGAFTPTTPSSFSFVD